MTTKYSIDIHKHDVRLEATYRSGHLRRIEIKRGKFIGPWWPRLHEALPVHETGIERATELYEGRVSYERVNPSKGAPSMFKRFNDAWFDFYMDLTGANPKFSGADGKALKSIIRYLEEVSANGDEAFAMWQQILSGWKTLDSFTQKKVELTYINSHLNSIIVQLTNGATSREKAANAADSIRKEF